MNNVLFDYLDDFVVVYLDDIVIYSRTSQEHVNHLSLVLPQLRKYTLYVKMEKCEFAQQEIKFLGHLVSKNNVRMDHKKVQAIVDWQAPFHVKDLRSFLGLANYYRKFIAGYSKKAAALTDLLKKDTKWVWSEWCDEAFQNLKNAIASEPILKLPDFELPFEVHTDASDKAIGGTMDYGIRYKFDGDLNLIGYSDSDWAGSIDGMKSTSGYAFLFGSSICSWLSKQQSLVAQSTVEAGYVSSSKATFQAIWLRRIFEDIGHAQVQANKGQQKELKQQLQKWSSIEGIHDLKAPWKDEEVLNAVLEILHYRGNVPSH
uniref:Reverse transcriptase domain-containing protein n=1 Tax=Solanum lycopersicum TaxID=4081 RepID=A0A3Q7EC56_SOLLC